jgi:hypothetical protein
MAFNHKNQLSICNFTDLQDMKTHYNIDKQPINFDIATQTLWYKACASRDINPKKAISKAKYLNGNFAIEDCDERHEE